MIDKNKLITELDKLDCISNINDYTNNCNSHDDIISTINEVFENEELSAEEMFEELGWEKVHESQCSIIYERGYRTCSFLKKNEQENVIDSSGHISIDMLKAINQQCKELGWL